MKVLCVEPIEYFINIVDNYSLKHIQFEFDGRRYYKKEDVFFKQYDAVISIQYLWSVCNVVIAKAKAANTPTYLLTDGILEWNNSFNNKAVIKAKNRLFSNILHDFFLCPGIFESSFVKDNSYSYIPSKVIYYEHTTMNIKQNKTVLLTTANSAYFDEREKLQVISLLNQVIKLLEAMSNVDITLRIFDDSLLEAGGFKYLNNNTKTSFESLLAEVDVVITTPSSIVLTSMMAKLPTCQLIYRNSPLFLQSGWMMHNSCDIAATLADLLSYNEERMIFQENTLKVNYESQNLIEIIKDGNKKFSKDTKNLNINKHYKKMLESPFNFNFEFLLRKIYKRAIKFKKVLYRWK